ncbi:MAG: hypothetical protein ACLP1D_10290 [Xanthobacteraceae bacterium]
MAIGIDRSRLGGTILSGRSVEVDFGFGVYDGFVGVGYSEKRERKGVQGSRKDLRIVGVTAGVYTPGALTLKFLQATALMLKEQLAAQEPNGTSYGDAAGPNGQGNIMTITADEPLAQGPIILYTFRSVFLVEPKFDIEITADEVKEELGFFFGDSDENGLSLFSSQQ